MARRRARARSSRPDRREAAPTRRNASVGVGLDPRVVPRVLVGAVDGVEIVAVGALQLARNVLVSTVSGAASIGAEALMATTAGARGVVSAASQMVGDLAETAGGTLRDTFTNARHFRLGPARMALRRPPPSLAPAGAPALAPSARDGRVPRSARRTAGRPDRPGAAA
jgi:hypothetical protein